jgi:hypothetical protein
MFFKCYILLHHFTVSIVYLSADTSTWYLRSQTPAEVHGHCFKNKGHFWTLKATQP